jgi:hypothetical protein
VRCLRSSKRYELAQKTFDKPVVIVTQAEAEAAEKALIRKKHGNLALKNVRDSVSPLRENSFLTLWLFN